MKKLICIFLATLSIANAEVVASVKNNANGLLVLTDEVCEGNSKFFAYSTSDSANTQFGCWFSDSLMIHITWRDGSVRSYDFTGWQVNVEVAKKLKSKNRQTL
jgi:hypothetical protein